MAAVDYTGIEVDVAQAIADAGREVTISKSGETVVDPASPWDTDAATGGATLTPIAAMIDYNLRDIDGESVKVGDQMAFITGSEVPATQDMRTFDRLLDDTEAWRIVEVQVIKPGPVIVLYILQLRRV